MSQPDKRCGNCRWWAEGRFDGYSVMECRRHPPTAVIICGVMFPQTREDHWCGDWAKKSAPTSLGMGPGKECAQEAGNSPGEENGPICPGCGMQIHGLDNVRDAVVMLPLGQRMTARVHAACEGLWRRGKEP